MAVRLIRKSWWVDIRFEHTRYRKRSPENSRAGALAYEAVLRQKLSRGDDILGKNPKPEVQTFAEFAGKWFDEYVLPNNRVSEQRSKKYALSGSLVPFFGQMAISDIGSRDVERFKAKLLQQGLLPNTVNNKLTILKKFLRVAYEWLTLEGAPPKIVLLKAPPPKTDYLSQEECERLLQHATGTTREMILTALRTGMRQGELKGLQWTSVDWHNRSVVVQYSYSDLTKSLESPKSNRERHIPLDIDLYEALAARRQSAGYVFVDRRGKPFDHTKLSRALCNASTRAGIRRIGWHTLRHTFASHLAMNGTPLNIVQALLGHSSVLMTMRYAHVAPSALRTAIDLANPRTADAPQSGQPAGNRWLEQQLKQRQAFREISENQAAAPSNPVDGSALAA